MKTQSTLDLDRARDTVLELASPAGTTDPHARSASLVARLAALFGHTPPTDGAPASWTELDGTIDVRVAVLVLPDHVARQLLPDGLELAPQPVVPSGYHPVLVLCSREVFHTRLGTMDYADVALGVPY